MFHVEQMKKLRHIEKCPVCSSKELSAYITTKDYFFTQEEFTLSKCDNCNFVFTNPIPEEQEKYYETTNYLSHNTSDNGAIGKLYNKLRNINIKRKYKLVSSYIATGSILDIGCGTGELLNFFKENNWSVTGVEPNDTARAFTKSNYKIEINEEDKLDQFEANSFDVITMWHVLEHVPDLNKRIKQISNLLKKDGTIFIALPNLDSPDSKKYKKYWSALDVPRHLYHFTQNSFTELISKHNMKLIHAEPMKFDAYYVSMLSEKYLQNSMYLPSAFITGLISNLKARKKNNYSSMIYVVKKM